MEDTLRGSTIYAIKCAKYGLNHCFNGRYSQRHNKTFQLVAVRVLILVLMEDTLKEEFEYLEFEGNFES